MLLSASAWASLLAGFSTVFTISVVGEMPLGEIVLIGAASWAALCAIFNRTWPVTLLKSRLLHIWLAAQFIAFCAYVVADIYWQSSPNDIARGWSRMAFLAIDIVAVAYLFGCARRNFLIFLAAQCVGEIVSALWLGPMFGDMWKFGVGSPLTYLGLLGFSWLGPMGAFVSGAGLGVLNFVLDYRSLGGLCFAVALLTGLQRIPRRLRGWLAPVMLTFALVVLLVYVRSPEGGERATRSDVERSAMMTAAAEAFEESPLIGHGSWFSQSHVYDNFMIIRQESAAAAHVGGFADANTDPGAVAIHSQILVALAEGGLFGGAFFFVFGGALLYQLYDLAFRREWRWQSSIYFMFLLSAVWNLLLSPFSGAHRIYIAMACGLILILREERALP